MKQDGSKKYLYLVIFLVVLCIFTNIVHRVRNIGPKLESVGEYDNSKVTVGVVEDYVFEEKTKELLPKVKIKVFKNREDAFKALEGGAIDGVVDDEAYIRSRLRGEDDLQMVDGALEQTDYSFVFPKDEKGKKLRDQYSEYVSKLRKDGELEALDAKWFGDETNNKVSEDYRDLEDKNGTLTIAYEANSVPFVYRSRQLIVGYEMDIAIGFCKEYGYALKPVEVGFAEILNGVKGGKYDAGFGGITVTEERAKDIHFGEPDYKGGIVICAAKKVEKHSDGGFLNGLRDNFHDAFVEGNRFKIFTSGIIATLLLMIGGVLCGTPIGMIMYILSRRGNLFLRLVFRFQAWLTHGIPAIMIIMSLYYSYYMNMYYGGFIAASIGFFFVFGAEVYRIIERWAGKLDNGEFERDYRVDYLTTNEFFRELLQRSGEDVIYDYREAIIRLLKATSIVGYISVQDMTKVVDTIRMESFELALPLFLTTVVYFIIISIISRVVRIKPGRSNNETLEEDINEEIVEETEKEKNMDKKEKA